MRADLHHYRRANFDLSRFSYLEHDEIIVLMLLTFPLNEKSYEIKNYSKERKWRLIIHMSFTHREIFGEKQ